MKVLAIDTADRDRVTCALVDGDQHTGRTVHGAGIDRSLVPLLQDLGLEGLGAVVVVVGPGSYTGVRAGVAAGLGLVGAAGLPLHGVGALEVVAHGAPAEAGAVGAVAGAGRGGLHVGTFRRGGGGLLALDPPHRVDTLGWRPDPALTWVALERAPEGVDDAAVLVADATAALAAAARAALQRPPLAPDRLDAAVRISGRPRSARV